MKKGLSILLVAAALFGFYGGAVNLNDVLACKDYWEKAGEESTANMNKLEDGLNQLKENEQAYLDGKDQVAEGEKTLAEGEATLAQGEADYAAAPGKLADARKKLAAGEKELAAGKAKLAKGKADYAAAPGKLADAKKQLAAGEKEVAAGEAKLAAGYKSYNEAPALLAQLQESIDNLKFARTSYNDYSLNEKGEKGPSWKEGFEKKATKADFTDAGLQQAKAVITQTVNAKKPTLDAAAGLGGMSSSLADQILNAKTYAAFNDALNSGVEPLAKAAVALNDLSNKANAALEAKSEEFNTAATLIGNPAARQKQIDDLNSKKTNLSNLRALISGYYEQHKQAGDTNWEVPATLVNPSTGETVDIPKDYQKKATVALATIDGTIKAIDDGIKKLSDTMNLKKEVAQGIGTALEQLGGSDKLAMVKKLDEDLYNSLTTDLAILTLNENAQSLWKDDTTYAKTIGQFASDMAALAQKLADSAAEAESTSGTFKSWCAGYNQLKAGKDTLAGGLSAGFKDALNHPTIRPVLDSKAPKLVSLLKAYSGDKLNSDDLDAFNDDMKVVADTVIPGLIQVLNGIKAEGLKTYQAAPAQLAQGEKDLAAGKAKLADGYKQYEQGLADYKAAPAKLAQGEKDLAAGKAKLADGYKQYEQGLADYEAAPAKLEDGRRQLEEGRQQLADGKAKLAQYEDGEQQVRDGLATLTATEADLSLKSILERLNGDDDFDNGDNHLDIDEGLAAVEVGRGYQAEDGVLITDEIMARAVGTGALLGAGVLAVLAAILSFLKKNKGAGVLAILAAAAGAFGAFYGTQAGTYFSNIAGSTVGSTGWVAAGILGAVALVHAIAHFTAGKEA